jgi:hypothetical protein
VEGDFNLSGFTWNLLECGYSKADNSNLHSNNPFNRSESASEYLSRKMEQLQTIGRLMDTHQFGLLQEADFLFPDNNRSVERPWMKDVFCALVWSLSDMLNKKGCRIQLYWEKEVAIIHSASLSHKSYNIEFPYVRKGKIMDITKYAMYTCIFESEGKNICLGSFHAQFGVDYTEPIETFRKETLSKADITIIGGDANHPSNYQFPGLLTLSENDVTNFYTNYNETDPYTKVELHDHRNGAPKNYDGFLVFTDASVTTRVSGEHYWDKEVVDGKEIPVLKEIIL